MKILFIAPRCPFPADTGGKIRTLNLVKEAAREAAVDLVCFSFEDGEERLAGLFEEWGISLHLVPPPRRGIWRQVCDLLLGDIPYSVAKYGAKAMQDAVDRLCAVHRYDVVHFDHIHTTHYLAAAGRRPAVIDEHNVEYRILERCADADRLAWKRVIYRRQAAKMRRFETRQAAAAAACTAVSEEDAAILREMTGGKVAVHVLPNGVDTEFFKGSHVSRHTSDVDGHGSALVFTGSMDWLPNDDAAVWFCREILPLIWKSKPETCFTVVGKSPSAALRGLAGGDSRIVVTGRVDDVRQYVGPAQVFVVPLRIGGGTRLKILEAMAMEKAVVSTTVGAEGIAHTAGADIVLADTPVDFAAAVVRLLADRPAREALGRAGRKLVEEHYDWRIVGRSLRTIYRKVSDHHERQP